VTAIGDLAELQRQHQNLEEFFVRRTERDEPAPIRGQESGFRGQ